MRRQQCINCWSANSRKRPRNHLCRLFDPWSQCLTGLRESKVNDCFLWILVCYEFGFFKKPTLKLYSFLFLLITDHAVPALRIHNLININRAILPNNLLWPATRKRNSTVLNRSIQNAIDADF